MNDDFAKQDASFSEGLSVEAAVLQHYWPPILDLDSVFSLFLTISLLPIYVCIKEAFYE